MNDPNTLIEYSNKTRDVYINIKEYNANRKCNILIDFDYKTADMVSNKNLIPIATKLFIRGRKQNIYTVFITQSYFQVPKDDSLNCKHFLVMKIPNKQ